MLRYSKVESASVSHRFLLFGSCFCYLLLLSSVNFCKERVNAALSLLSDDICVYVKHLIELWHFIISLSTFVCYNQGFSPSYVENNWRAFIANLCRVTLKSLYSTHSHVTFPTTIHLQDEYKVHAGRNSVIVTVTVCSLLYIRYLVHFCLSTGWTTDWVLVHYERSSEGAW